MTDKNLGHATAYGYAKSKGYTGTEEEFAELMASYAEVAESAKGYAEQAEASATNAETSETNARASASTASTKASEASTSASNAQTSASNAQASATSAGTSASSASASAQTASTKASEASDSATSASESASTAVSAKDDAVTAKEEAKTAKADAETAAEEAQESAQTVANKADKDGTYPDMTVGGVMSSDGFTDSTPYLYRESGGGVEVGTVEEDSIVGGTVAWNQLAQNGNFANASGWSATRGTLSVSNNICSYTSTEIGGGSLQNRLEGRLPVIPKGHRVMLIATVKPAHTTTFRCHVSAGANGVMVPLKIASVTSGSWTEILGINSFDNDISGGYSQIWLALEETSSNGYTVGDVDQFRNIQIFDLTQMFGSSVADYIYSLEQSSTGAGVAFFRKLFPKDYYEYNTGELMSVEGVSAHVMRDADDNIIGSYPLDSSLTLRGIPKVADGKMYFDGDTYEADGTVTRKYGVITYDGSTDEAWRIQSAGNTTFYIENSNLKKGTDYSGEIICDKLKSTKSHGYMSDDYIISGYIDAGNQYPNQNWIYVQVNSSITDGGALKTWLQSNPITLVYELATPTEETAQAYTEYQKVSKYGTEEYVSTGIVPVGHVTKYPTDIVAKVNGLPSDFSTLIAPTETGFKASRAYSVNQFIIVDNQLYRVTSAIASGATITVGTNVVATTIADILTSLLNA